LRALYLALEGGLAIMSETKGNAVLSKFNTTYLNCMSSLDILEMLNAASTCTNQRVGFSFQNDRIFAAVISDGGSNVSLDD